MKVPLLNLKVQYKAIKDDVDIRVAEVFESQYFINDQQVKECGSTPIELHDNLV